MFAVAAFLPLASPAFAGDNPGAPSPGTAPSSSPFRLSGYIQGRFTHTRDTPERWEIRRARLAVTGDAATWLGYTVQVDVLKRPRLMDAALEFRASPGLRVTLGQFKLPFSYESLLADNRSIPIERARVVNSLAPGRDTGVQGRDRGLQLGGSFGSNKRTPAIEYSVGVFRGDLFVNSPKIHYRAAAGRFVVHPFRGLSLGADLYRSFADSRLPPKQRWSVEAIYQCTPFFAAAEWISGTDGALKRNGAYALGAWRFARAWEVLAQADSYTGDARRSNTTSRTYLAGVNRYLTRFVKLQANAGARSEPAPLGWSGILLAQLQLSF